MSKYKGLFTFDVDNHRFIPTAQADGIIDVMDYVPIDAEPLIKDEKVRKAVRAWAEANDDQAGLLYKFDVGKNGLRTELSRIEFDDIAALGKLRNGKKYTIAELCGEEEAPEPLEPAFIDMDERIREKEDE